LPAQVQPLFEGGRLAAALAEADAEAAALVAIERAADASKESGPIVAVGLVGEEPAADLAASRTAFETGRLDDAIAAAATARATWLAAEDVGRYRLAVFGLIVGAVGLGLLVVLRSWRPRQRAHARRRMDRATPR
jgi:hypothetical protein